MRKHRSRSGRYRFLIIIIIIIIAATAAVVRLAAGRRKSGSVNSGAVSGAQDAAVAEGSTLLSPSTENPQASAGGPQSGPSVNSGSDISGQTASAGTSPAGGGGQPGTSTGPAGGGIPTGTGTAPADSTAASASTGNPAAAPASDPAAAPAGQGTTAAGGAAEAQGAGKEVSPTGTDTSSDASTRAASAPTRHVVSEIETGKAYLDSLDQRSPVEMEYRIDQARAVYEKEQDRKAYLKKRELYRQTLEDDGVWDQFDKYVFLGDSRVVGYNVFGFLPEERVLAEQGDTILAISDRIDAIKELDPSYIFISYGINDINIGIWPTAGEYAHAFGEKIDDLRKELPDAQIYVNSIIPATDEAVESVSLWGKIPEYSDALKNMCAEKGIPFIDNTKLMEEHKELYAGDGVHLLAEFYPYWAQNQLLGIYDLKNGRDSEGYKLGDKTGQASGQGPASDKDKTGGPSSENPASNPASNKEKAAGNPGQNPEPNKEKAAGNPGQNPESNKSEAGEISGDAPVSNKDKTGTD